MESSSKSPRPSDRLPKPSDRLPKPSDRSSNAGKAPLYKDRRAHRIELRQKITKFKEEINELKEFETEDEEKKAAVQERISELKIRLKECVIEKEAIGNFNHTQFMNNLDASGESQSRFNDESTGNTRFFDQLKESTASKDEESKGVTGDPFLANETNLADDAVNPDSLIESSESPTDS